MKQYLLKHGVSSSRVNTAGYGADKKLIQHPISKEEKALNMRVEVKIIYRGENSKRGILNSGPNK